MSEGEDYILVFGQQLFKRQGFLEVERQGLVADHMDARLDEGLRRREMHVVRRDDGNRFDAIFAFGLGLRHLAEIPIDAVRRQSQFFARSF